MFPSLWWWMVPAVLLSWAVGAHNRLVRLRGAVLQTFTTVDAQMQRWIALAESPAVPWPADVPAGDAAPAQALWAGVHAAALQLGASLAATRARPLDLGALAALGAAREVLRSAWLRLLQDSPAFASSVQAGGVHVLWDQQDTQVQLACDQFNLAVERYNTAIGAFPAVLLAWIFRFIPARPL